MHSISINDITTTKSKEKEDVVIPSYINTMKNILILVLFIFVAISCLYTLKLTKANTALSAQIESMTTSHNNTITEYEAKYQEATETITTMKSVTDDLEAQAESLVASNEEYRSQLQEYSERSELYDKYGYAIYNGNERTDITYDQLQTAESLCEEKGVDIDYVLATIMTESGGNETAQSSSSTAKGFGQLLYGTAKYVYEDIMGNGKGTYQSSYALNGTTNIEMTIAYIDYLQDNNSSIYKVIDDYRGITNCTGYQNKINSYLKQAGKSLSGIGI